MSRWDGREVPPGKGETGCSTVGTSCYQEGCVVRYSYKIDGEGRWDAGREEHDRSKTMNGQRFASPGR
jgi:hypothetical protein